MDHNRYYIPTSLDQACPSWSENHYTQMAERIFGRCVDHYETHPQRSVGTLYVGALGPLVYLRFRMAVHISNTNKDEASKLLRHALTVSEGALRHEGHHRHRVSLLEGSWFGAKALRCAILYRMDKANEASSHARELLNVLTEECRALPASECEVLYGRAGALQMIWFLREHLQDKSLGNPLALTLAAQILREGLECSRRSSSPLPLLWEWHGTYLGAAHGVVGILHTLLQLQPEEIDTLNDKLQVPVHDLIKQTIHGLDEFCLPSGNLRSSIDSNRDRLVHWCHGAPGHVMLLAKASQVYNDSTYLDRAKEIATNVIMKRGLLRKGVGLCHGISGNAYSLLTIGRMTEDPIWMQRGKSFAHFALDHLNELEMIPDRPYSLYEGVAALAVLLLDLCCPETSAFPLFEFM